MGAGMLESGHRFMPNVSTGKLTKAIEGERNPTAKFRLLACRSRKNGYSIRKICRELGTAYSTVRDWLVRMGKRGLKGRFNRRRMGRRGKLPQFHLQNSPKVVAQGAEQVRIRVRFLAAQHDT